MSAIRAGEVQNHNSSIYSPLAWTKPLEVLVWRHLIGDCARTVNGGRLSPTRRSPTPPWGYVGRMIYNPSCCASQAVVAAISFHRARLSALRDQAKLPQPRRHSRNVKREGLLKTPLNAKERLPASYAKGTHRCIGSGSLVSQYERSDEKSLSR
jgi:hypothetical protein